MRAKIGMLFVLVSCLVVAIRGFNDSESNVESKFKGLEHTVNSLEKTLRSLGKDVEVLNQVGTSFKDCGEIYHTGIRGDGVYTISPDGSCPFKVYCDMTHGGWMVIQKRIDGSINFYQPWTSYVNGFGDLTGEHWLGLQKIHRLTTHGAQIYFNMTRTADQRIDFGHYKYFKVEDSTTDYTMRTDNQAYEGTIPDDMFMYHNGRKFTTYDRDNDGHGSANCAQLLSGGAW
ncbi:ANGL1-like protein [Mya arenaria]|uniref:ANGL1-like protein n=1 Tax=Mya arenaria TaxID=6604 RepID=A0ABY7F9F2_MYAAR|nr:angiopoietin-related protein 7-like [Mya arenaria]WAR17419.1 ANGL1-like protein [Mya arenaria]